MLPQTLRVKSIVFALALAGSVPAFAQVKQVPFDDPAWNLKQADGAEVTDHNGRQSLRVEGGMAMLDGVDLSNGVIDVDVSTPTPAAFAGIAFRAASAREYELVYVRLHSSGEPDAVQYTPVFNGSVGWQLYGPGEGWARAFFDKNGWVPLRVQMDGNRLQVFAGQGGDPVLTTRLRQDQGQGTLAVWGLNGAYFSDFRYNSTTKSSPDLPDKKPAPGTITQWELTSAFPSETRDLARLPEEDALDWHPASSEPSGLLNIARVIEPAASPAPPDTTAAYARVTIESDQRQHKKLRFGYSDDVVVFLNGTRIFAGRSGYKSRSPLFQGMIGYHDSVFLDLKEGTNELVFAVAEGFGGWGLMARFEDPSGLTLERSAR